MRAARLSANKKVRPRSYHAGMELAERVHSLYGAGGSSSVQFHNERGPRGANGQNERCYRFLAESVSRFDRRERASLLEHLLEPPQDLIQ